MVSKTVTINDSFVPGIDAAWHAHTAAHTTKDKDGNDVIDDEAFPSADAYFSARCNDMVRSWANQYGVASDSQDKAMDEFVAKLPEDKRVAVQTAIKGVLPSVVVKTPPPPAPKPAPVVTK